MPDQNRLLQQLPPGAIDKLRPHLRLQKFASGHVLFAPDDKIGSIYFPISGAVSLVIQLANGQMIESAIVGRDGAVGGGVALDDRDALYKAIVQVGSAGYLLDVETARHAANDSEDFRRAIIRHEQLILLQAQQSAACNATHSLNQRLARWLLRVRDVTGSDSFLLTQEFMAEMLGVRRSSLSIVAHTFQQSGLISYRRGNVRVENLEALTQMACECYGEIRLRYQKVLNIPGMETKHPLGNTVLPPPEPLGTGGR